MPSAGDPRAAHRIMDFINRLLKSRFGRRGLPFILIVAGGSFALSQVTDARYKAAHHKRTLGLTKEQLKGKGWEEDTTNIYDEYKEMQENVDLNNWENIRGPRPWEDDNQKYIDIINQRIKETEERKKKANSFWAA